MSRTKPTETVARTSDGMRKEYDMRGGVRGKYYGRFGTRKAVMVVLSDKVADVFPDSKSVNDMLEPLVDAINARRRSPRAAKPRAAPRKAG